MPRCRSCPTQVIFAVTANGVAAPFEADPAGEWIIEDGRARHVGRPAAQLELGVAPPAPRYTSHFAKCPKADQWRRR